MFLRPTNQGNDRTSYDPSIQKHKVISSRLIRDRYSLVKNPFDSDKLKDFVVSNSDGATVRNGGALLAKIAASHWGYINDNGFWYDPDTVDGSLPTWTTPYNKPVLGFHPSLEDGNTVPLGRILSAKYVKGMARDFVDDEIIPDNIPDGHLRFLTRIPDEVAAKRVITGLYDTVSISALATNVRCSICGGPAASGNTEHEHKRFHWYSQEDVEDRSSLLDAPTNTGTKIIKSSKGSLCYYMAGPLAGRHVAFVLTPSDKYAGVLEYGIEEVDNIDDSTGYSTINDVHEIANMEIYVLSDKDKVFLSLNEGNSENLYDELRDELKIKSNTVVIDMIYGVEKAVTEKIKDNGTVKDNTQKGRSQKGITQKGNSHNGGENMKDERKDLSTGVSTDGDTGKQAVNDSFKNTQIDTETLIMMEESDIDAIMNADDTAFTEDAKLTAAARKKLPDSVFCGPGRSFPAHDKTHVTAALRLINRSKYSASTKASILSCVRGKAKKMGMKVSAKVRNSADDVYIEETSIVDVLLSDATMDDLLGLDMLLEYINNNYTPKQADLEKAQPEAQRDASNTSSGGTVDDSANTPETVTTSDAEGTAKPTDNNDTSKPSTEAVDAKTTDANGDGTTVGVTGDVKADAKVIDDEVKSLMLKNADLHKQLKSSIIERILDYKVHKRMLTKDQVEDERKSLSERTIESLKDTLDDVKKDTDVFSPDEEVRSRQISGPGSNKSWFDSLPERSGTNSVKALLTRGSN
jgi:hypothetical protein